MSRSQIMNGQSSYTETEHIAATLLVPQEKISGYDVLSLEPRPASLSSS